jgi:hypothetical protein
MGWPPRQAFRIRWSLPQVRDGIDELARAYTEQGMTYDDFNSSRFVRLRRIRDLLSAGLLDDLLRRETKGYPPAEAARTARKVR